MVKLFSEGRRIWVVELFPTILAKVRTPMAPRSSPHTHDYGCGLMTAGCGAPCDPSSVAVPTSRQALLGYELVIGTNLLYRGGSDTSYASVGLGATVHLGSPDSCAPEDSCGPFEVVFWLAKLASQASPQASVSAQKSLSTYISCLSLVPKLAKDPNRRSLQPQASAMDARTLPAVEKLDNAYVEDASKTVTNGQQEVVVREFDPKFMRKTMLKVL